MEIARQVTFFSSTMAERSIPTSFFSTAKAVKSAEGPTVPFSDQEIKRQQAEQLLYELENTRNARDGALESSDEPCLQALIELLDIDEETLNQEFQRWGHVASSGDRDDEVRRNALYNCILRTSDSELGPEGKVNQVLRRCETMPRRLVGFSTHAAKSLKIQQTCEILRKQMWRIRDNNLPLDARKASVARALETVMKEIFTLQEYPQRHTLLKNTLQQVLDFHMPESRPAVETMGQGSAV